MEKDLKNTDWSEFEIGDIFNVFTGNLLPKTVLKKGRYPRITATENNNGVFDYYQKVDHKKYKEYKNFISISFLGAVFYHPYTASLDMKIHSVQLKNLELNKYLAGFLVLCLKRTVSIFSYGDQLSSTDLPKKRILLPIDSQGEPDYAFMEQYMRQKEQEKLDKVKSYISKRVEQVKDYKEIEPLSEKEWGEFFIEDIAEIASGRDIYDKERKRGNTPYVTSTALNNGVGYYVRNANETLEKNCLSVNRNGSVGYSFYHPYEALFSNDCRKLRLKNTNVYVGKFISRVITSQKEKYGYGYKMGTGRIKRQKILLPIDIKGQPDYFYMENYIKRMEYNKLKKYLDLKYK